MPCMCSLQAFQVPEMFVCAVGHSGYALLEARGLHVALLLLRSQMVPSGSLVEFPCPAFILKSTMHLLKP